MGEEIQQNSSFLFISCFWLRFGRVAVRHSKRPPGETGTAGGMRHEARSAKERLTCLDHESDEGLLSRVVSVSGS
jgi:hypothetical protein